MNFADVEVYRAMRGRLMSAVKRGRIAVLDIGSSNEDANADEGGFYRPLHRGDLLARLGEDFGRLASSERMGILGHQWAGVRADRASLADFLDLVDRLGDESRPEVLEAVLGPLAWLRDQAVPRLGADDQVRFTGWLSARFGGELAALGWDPGAREPDAERARRQTLLRIVGGGKRDDHVSRRRG